MLFVILFAALIFVTTIILIVFVSNDMRVYSSLINDTGKIRGGIQRTVKLELAGQSCQESLEVVDNLIHSAHEQEESRFLQFSYFMDFRGLLSSLEHEWTTIKKQLSAHRAGADVLPQLLASSERAWTIADAMVASIERTSFYNVILYYVFAALSGIGVIGLVIVFTVTKLYIRDKMEYLVDHDQLTGLFNRHYFTKALDREYNVSRRNQRPFCLLIADIDHFKHVNDTYGHMKGDEVLAGIARTLFANSRESDIVARFGGEEFIILSLNDDARSCTVYAERLREAVEALDILPDEKVTISVGAVVYQEGKSVNELIMMADNAMYNAKKSGRNCVRLAP